MTDLYRENAFWSRRLVVVSRDPVCSAGYWQVPKEPDELSVSKEQSDQLERLGVHVQFTNLNGPRGVDLVRMNIDPEKDYILFYKMNYRDHDGELLTQQGFTFEVVEDIDELLLRVFSLLKEPIR